MFTVTCDCGLSESIPSLCNGGGDMPLMSFVFGHPAAHQAIDGTNLPDKITITCSCGATMETGPSVWGKGNAAEAASQDSKWEAKHTLCNVN